MRAPTIHHPLVSLLCALVGAELQAQPTASTDQGRLNENGSPASGLYDFTLTLYDSRGGSTVVVPATVPAKFYRLQRP